MTFFTPLSRTAALWLAALCCLPGTAAAQGAEPPAFGLIVGYRDGADELRRDETDRGPWANGRERAQAAWQRAVVRSRERTTRLAKDTGVKVKSVGEAGRSALMRFDKTLKGEALADAMRRVRLHPDVAWVEPDVLVKRQQVPDDPGYVGALQWHLLSVGAGGASAMNVTGAWAVNTGTNVVVAVVDSGIRPNHPDLSAQLVPGYDFVSEMPFSNDGGGRDGNPEDPGDWVDKTGNATAIQQLVDAGTCGDFTADPNRDRSSWHGTFIAGQIAAATNNNQGVAGINWAASILPVRVSGKCGALVSDLLDGVRWAAGLPVDGVPTNTAHPARVINLSFGGSAACSPAYQTTIDDVTDAGALVVVAAGNASGELTRPADCQGVMAVASVRRDGAKADYSSFGPQVALSAPGGSDEAGNGNLLYSTDNDGDTVPVTDGYGYKQGTSFSAPQAVGVASLMLAVNDKLTPSALIQRMKDSARPHVTVMGLPTCSLVSNGDCNCTVNTCGAGLLDAAAALQEAGGPAAVIERIGSVLPGALIVLDGSGSAPPGTIQSYQWTLLSGPSVTIPSPTQASTSLRLPTVEGRYVFQLQVSDGVASGTDTVTVVAAYPNGGGGGGGMGWWWGAGLWAWVLGALFTSLRRR